MKDIHSNKTKEKAKPKPSKEFITLVESRMQ